MIKKIRKLKTKLKWWLRGKHPGDMTRDEHIAALKKAILRKQWQMDDMAWYAHGEYCPGCVYGRQWTELCDAQERRISWLCVLLNRRGLPKDYKFIDKIAQHIWP